MIWSLPTALCLASAASLPMTAPTWPTQSCAPRPMLVPRGIADPGRKTFGNLGAPELKALHDYAQAITVRILVKGRWGSGFLIQRQGSLYTLLTNEHVVSGGSQFEVETPDGAVHQAWLPQNTEFGNYDLALLQFQSPDLTYPVAKLGPSLALPVGTPVLAVGFPIDQVLRTTATPLSVGQAPPPLTLAPALKFTVGHISVIPPKALPRGYQFGYSNWVEKGMSGGPVLNLKGEVIAVNGMHAYPLWGDPYVFVDGSKPSASMHEVMVASSFGIPMEVVLQLAPAVLQLHL